MIGFEFRFDQDALNAAVLDTDRAAAIALEALEVAMLRAVHAIQPAVLSLTPKGASSTLRRSYGVEVKTMGYEVTGTVHNAAQHAPYVEFGTGPHVPPVGPLIEWARFKFGLDEKQARAAGFAIQRAIARRGTHGQHYMELGLEKSEPRLLVIFEQMQDAIIKSLREQ